MVGSNAVETHYSNAGIVDRILATFDPGEEVTPDTLAPMDHFHGRGLNATRDLAVLLDPQPNDHVLDLGCGIGGPARWFAAHFKCRVSGIDLTADYCAAASALTEATGQTDRVRITHGNALETPYEDATFDRAYSQNVVMNIADKQAIYREAFRVLKPGGLLALSNLGEGPNGPPYYPTPWAESAETSFLASLEQTRTDLQAVGFEIGSLEDATPRIRPLVIATLEKFESEGFPERNVYVVLGERFRDLQFNSMRSTRDGKLTMIEALVRKPVR
ncbi:MAG: class I SAM-dependent methyltransferase [Nitrospira sp.]|nr:class I SAM-dependent methyltransferase [Nitrospira sp.]